MELNKIYQGDCLEVMKTFEDNSIDAIVTDPPYGLSFMGKKWDYDVPSQEIWEECLRVLRPGGYLLSFAGTRTQHRMAVRIEDAGFEIRDIIMYVYGSGFPKSLNINKQLLKKVNCGNMEEYERNKQKTKSQMSQMWKATILTTLAKKENNNRGSLQELLEDLEQGEQYEIFTSSSIREEIQIPERQRQSCLERWSDLPTSQGELHCKCKICSLPTGIFVNGKKRWLCYGTQTNNGETSWEVIDENGVCSSYKSQSIGQSLGELNVVCKQCGTQIIRSEGLGSALKPACEPITVARKPISEKNLASNFLKWGVGGINIDECRVDGGDGNKIRKGGATMKDTNVTNFQGQTKDYTGGRFPANLIHDGSDEVVSLFPNTNSSARPNCDGKNYGENTQTLNMKKNTIFLGGFNDSGSASRFFYCAKASKSERNMGNINCTHPTVKPIALMEYLVKLVSREGALVLDPFAGSGSTLIACKKLNRNYIGIELTEEYIPIIEARLSAVKINNKLF
jgi:DNA modification methylase